MQQHVPEQSEPYDLVNGYKVEVPDDCFGSVEFPAMQPAAESQPNLAASLASSTQQR